MGPARLRHSGGILSEAVGPVSAGMYQEEFLRHRATYPGNYSLYILIFRV